MCFVKHIDDLARKLISGLTRSIWGCLSRSKHPLFRLSTVGFRTSIKSWEWSSSWGLIASWQNLSTLLAWNSYVKHDTGYLDDLALYYFSYPFGLRWSQLTHFCCRVWPAGKGPSPMPQCQMALAPWPSSGNMLEGGQDDSIPWKPETTPCLTVDWEIWRNQHGKVMWQTQCNSKGIWMRSTHWGCHAKAGPHQNWQGLYDMLVDESIGLLAGIYHGNMLNAEVVRWNQRTGNLRVVGAGWRLVPKVVRRTCWCS